LGKGKASKKSTEACLPGLSHDFIRRTLQSCEKAEAVLIPAEGSLSLEPLSTSNPSSLKPSGFPQRVSDKISDEENQPEADTSGSKAKEDCQKSLKALPDTLNEFATLLTKETREKRWICGSGGNFKDI
jgi:hypothetical protein